jgi:hypothetical protein
MASPKTDAEETKTSAEYVKYTGGASRREITVADWRKAGVMDMKSDTNWTFGNSFRVLKKDFSADALEYLLRERRSNGTRSFSLVTE